MNRPRLKNDLTAKAIALHKIVLKIPMEITTLKKEKFILLKLNQTQLRHSILERI